MKYLLLLTNKLKPLLIILGFMLFILISINAIIQAKSVSVKIFIGLVALFVLLVSIYYEYLKHLYRNVQYSLITAQDPQKTKIIRDELAKKDIFKGMKDSIALVDTLLSLDENKPTETLQILEENDSLFRSNLDMLLINKHSTFKAQTLLNNRTQSKKAYDQLYKLKDTNLNKSKKMNLLYNWDQIEALNLSFNQHKYQQAYKLYESINLNKMNSRELIHYYYEIKECAKELKLQSKVVEFNKKIDELSQNSPFKENTI